MSWLSKRVLKEDSLQKTDNYIPVIVDDVKLGTFVDVKITEATATYLKSELL